MIFVLLYMIYLSTSALEVADIEAFLRKNDILQKITQEAYINDFIFIVDGEKYKTNNITADLISPIIHNFNLINKEINSFNIDTNGQFPGCNFSDFLSLFSPTLMKPINESCLPYFEYIFLILGNKIEAETLTVSNVFDIIKKKVHKYPPEIIDKEIKYAAQHFNDLNKDNLKKLDIKLIELIIESEDIMEGSDDSLLNFIIDLYLQNNELIYLFDYVLFTNISKDSLVYFIKNINHIDFTPNIFQYIINIAFKSILLERSNQTRKSQMMEKLCAKTFNKDNYKWKNVGIIDYASYNPYARNYYKESFLTFSSSYLSSMNGLNNYILISNYLSSNDKQAYIFFDFKFRKVKLDCYILVNPSRTDKDLPRSWKLLCSNDFFNWEMIDERKDVKVFDSTSFNCQFKNNNYYRYVKIISDDQNLLEKNDFKYEVEEFYGTILDINYTFKIK